MIKKLIISFFALFGLYLSFIAITTILAQKNEQPIQNHFSANNTFYYILGMEYQSELPPNKLAEELVRNSDNKIFLQSHPNLDLKTPFEKSWRGAESCFDLSNNLKLDDFITKNKMSISKYEELLTKSPGEEILDPRLDMMFGNQILIQRVLLCRAMIDFRKSSNPDSLRWIAKDFNFWVANLVKAKSIEYIISIAVHIKIDVEAISFFLSHYSEQSNQAIFVGIEKDLNKILIWNFDFERAESFKIEKENWTQQKFYESNNKFLKLFFIPSAYRKVSSRIFDKYRAGFKGRLYDDWPGIKESLNDEIRDKECYTGQIEYGALLKKIIFFPGYFISEISACLSSPRLSSYDRIFESTEKAKLLYALILSKKYKLDLADENIISKYKLASSFSGSYPKFEQDQKSIFYQRKNKDERISLLFH